MTKFLSEVGSASVSGLRAGLSYNGHCVEMLVEAQ